MKHHALLLIAALAGTSLAHAKEITCLEDANAGNRVARIVGGTDVTPDVSGWQVSLQIDGSHFCGGSVIDPAGHWVLTAAHCIIPNIGSDMPGPHFKVEHRSQVLGRGTVQQVAQIERHPDWNGKYREGNDIALLKLAAPLDVSPRVEGGAPYRNVVLRQTPEGRNAAMRRGDVCTTVTGWGSTEPVRAVKQHRSGTRSLPARLQKVTLPLVSKEACLAAYGQIGKDQICAGYAEGNKDSCQGDSGGPLVVLTGGQYRQMGVVSWGEGCAAANAYGVYTDVTYHADWIRQVTGL